MVGSIASTTSRHSWRQSIIAARLLLLMMAVACSVRGALAGYSSPWIKNLHRHHHHQRHLARPWGLQQQDLRRKEVHMASSILQEQDNDEDDDDDDLVMEFAFFRPSSQQDLDQIRITKPAIERGCQIDEAPETELELLESSFWFLPACHKTRNVHRRPSFLT